MIGATYRTGFRAKALGKEHCSDGGAYGGASGEEKTVPRQRDPASAGTARRPSCPPPLPDLTGVDLRTLSTLDDPALTAAVDHVLRNPADFTESWRDDGSAGG